MLVWHTWPPDSHAPSCVVGSPGRLLRHCRHLATANGLVRRGHWAGKQCALHSYISGGRFTSYNGLANAPSPSQFPVHGETGPPSNTTFHGTKWVCSTNGPAIGSAVFTQFTRIPYTQTHGYTSKPLWRVHAMRPKIQTLYLYRRLINCVCVCVCVCW